MTYLLLETALLMLGAYLLGAVLACLFKRTFAAKPIGSGAGGGSLHTPEVPDTQVTAMTMARSAPEPVKPLIETISPVPPDAARFERALTGVGGVAGAAVPPPAAASEPSPAPAAEPQPVTARQPGSTEIPRPTEPAPMSPPSRTPEPLARPAEAEADRHEDGDAAASAATAGPGPEQGEAAAEADHDERAVEAASEVEAATGTHPEPPVPVPVEADPFEPVPSPTEGMDEPSAPAAEDAPGQPAPPPAEPEAPAPEAAASAAPVGDEAEAQPEPSASTPAVEAEAEAEPPITSDADAPAAGPDAAHGQHADETQPEATSAETEPAPDSAAVTAAAEAEPEREPSAAPEENRASGPAPVSASTAIAAAAAAAAAVTGAFRSEAAEPAAHRDTDAAPPSQSADDLTRIRTIGPLLQRRLNDSGVWRFEEIARWSASDVNRFSQALGVQGDRIEQENWIEQAQILARGANTPATVGTGAEAAAAAAAVAAAAAIDPGKSETRAQRDRLTRIVGVTPDSEALLNHDGITRFSQVAAWTPAEIALYEGKLGYEPGRIAEENWVGQAQVLERGGDPDAAARPAKLADAIRGNADKAAGAAARAPLTGLRSVKSEALIDPKLEWSGQAGGVVNDLKRIRGIGVLIEKKLNSLGISTYEQVANWTGADVDRLSQLLDFKGRIERENWIEQARILASGGQTEFSRRLDKGDV